MTGADYIYAEQLDSEIAPDRQPPVLAKERLAVLPEDLKNQIYEATLRGRYDFLLKLIDQVAAIDLELSETLRRLIVRFDYETLLQLFNPGQ